MYVISERVTVGHIPLFARWLPLAIEIPEPWSPAWLEIYDRHTGVSGLNINIRKSTAHCIHLTPKLLHDLQQKGSNTPDTLRIWR
jgi:hypothetical protein